MKAILIAPDPRLSARHLAPAAAAAASTTPPARPTRSTPSASSGPLRGIGAGRLAPAALQPLEPRRRGLPARPEGLPRVNPLDLLEDPLRSLLDFLHENVNLTYGWSIVVLTVIVRLVPAAARDQAVRVDAADAGRRAAAQGAAGQVQGEPHQAQRRADEVLQRERDQPLRLLPAARRAAARSSSRCTTCCAPSRTTRRVQGGSLSFMWADPGRQRAAHGHRLGRLRDRGRSTRLSQLLSTELSATPNMPASQRRIMRFIPLVVVLLRLPVPGPGGPGHLLDDDQPLDRGQQLVMRTSHRPAPRRSRGEVRRRRPRRARAPRRRPRPRARPP